MEVLHFEGEFVVVVYHVSLRDSYPVSFPVGFISAEKDIVLSVGRLVTAYIEGTSGFSDPMTVDSFTFWVKQQSQRNWNRR